MSGIKLRKLKRDVSKYPRSPPIPFCAQRFWTVCVHQQLVYFFNTNMVHYIYPTYIIITN